MDSFVSSNAFVGCVILQSQWLRIQLDLDNTEPRKARQKSFNFDIYCKVKIEDSHNKKYLLPPVDDFLGSSPNWIFRFEGQKKSQLELTEQYFRIVTDFGQLSTELNEKKAPAWLHIWTPNADFDLVLG